MGTAIKHPVPDRVKPSFVIYVIFWASECLDAKNYNWRLNPVWHRMLYSCTHPCSNSWRVNYNTTLIFWHTVLRNETEPCSGVSVNCIHQRSQLSTERERERERDCYVQQPAT